MTADRTSSVPEAESLDDNLQWQQSADCRGLGTGLFFGDGPERLHTAREICASCPVMTECLAYAVAHADVMGTWAGTTARQRQKLRQTKIWRP